MATKSQTEPEIDLTDPLSSVAALQKAGFGNMMGMGAAWVEAFGDLSAEFVDFLADRIKEDVKTQHQILHCKDIGELQHIQAEFFQNAVEQYQAETGKLMKMSASAFSNALKDSSTS